MKQVTAIIEKSTDGLFSVYIENNPLRYGVIGEGKTVAEALEDFKGGYEDMRDYYKSEGLKKRNSRLNTTFRHFFNTTPTHLH